MRLVFTIEESKITELSRRLSRIPNTVIQELTLTKVAITTSLDFDSVLEHLKDINIIDIME